MGIGALRDLGRKLAYRDCFLSLPPVQFSSKTPYSSVGRAGDCNKSDISRSPVRVRLRGVPFCPVFLAVAKFTRILLCSQCIFSLTANAYHRRNLRFSTNFPIIFPSLAASPSSSIRWNSVSSQTERVEETSKRAAAWEAFSRSSSSNFSNVFTGLGDTC